MSNFLVTVADLDAGGAATVPQLPEYGFWQRNARLTPTAKYSVSAMLPKYVAVNGSRSCDTRWRTVRTNQP